MNSSNNYDDLMARLNAIMGMDSPEKKETQQASKQKNKGGAHNGKADNGYTADHKPTYKASLISADKEKSCSLCESIYRQ